MGTKSTLRLVLCASLVAVVFGQQPLPGLVNQVQNFAPRRQQNLNPQRQLVNEGFRNQLSQGFGNQANQGFGNQGNQGFGSQLNPGFGGQVNPGSGNQGNQGFGGQQNIVTSSPVRPIRQQVTSTPVRPSRPQVIVTQQQQSEILEDIRDGPFWDGSYYFRYQTSDGTIREEGGRPLPDGTMLVTGQYGYRAPNGEVIEMEYMAGTNGYRAFPKGTSADYIPPQRAVAPQGLPPFNQNFVGGNSIITAQPQPQPRPQPRPVARPRPINTQNFNQIQPVNNNLVRPGNNINNVNLNGIRPTPGNFQGQFQGFGANLSGLQFGQVNRDGQDISL